VAELQRLGQRQRAAAQTVPEGLTLDQLHHQDRHAVVGFLQAMDVPADSMAARPVVMKLARDYTR
jgi:hypothetical protein